MSNERFHTGGFVGKPGSRVPVIVGHQDYFAFQRELTRQIANNIGVPYDQLESSYVTAEFSARLAVQKEAFDRAVDKARSAFQVVVSAAYSAPKRPRTGDIEQMIDDIDHVEKTRATRDLEFAEHLRLLMKKPVRFR